MKKKKQILYIHGGNPCSNRRDFLKNLKRKEITVEKKIRWHDAYLDKELGRKFQIIRPRMPLSDCAKYEEWKIFFEMHFPFLKNNIILIGNSLGGIFLAKYLSENKFPKKISAVYLVCPPFDRSGMKEKLAGGFKLKSDLSMIEKNCKNVTLMFSADDDVVPVTHAEKYGVKLKNSKIIIYKSKKGHFVIQKFPEIIRMIKKKLSKVTL